MLNRVGTRDANVGSKDAGMIPWVIVKFIIAILTELFAMLWIRCP